MTCDELSTRTSHARRFTNLVYASSGAAANLALEIDAFVACIARVHLVYWRSASIYVFGSTMVVSLRRKYVWMPTQAE
ncbi:hypothetical protein FB451DRAFT_1213879, partial [Mycena latifolia]